MKIQIDTTKEIHKKLNIVKAFNGFKNLEETVIECLQIFFEEKDNLIFKKKGGKSE